MSELLHDSHVWVLISFLLFCVLAWKFGRKPAIGKLDARINEIRKEVETAESLRIEAQELLAQYQRKQRDATHEAEMIVKSAKKKAEEISKQLEKELDDMITRKEQQIQERLKRMEEASLNEIKAHAAELAVRATSEIIAKKMDEKSNARLVDQTIKMVGSQLN